MAIDTDTDKLAVMELGQVWEPGLPLAPGTLEQAAQQQLLWGYPGVLWQEAVASSRTRFGHVVTLGVGRV